MLETVQELYLLFSLLYGYEEWASLLMLRLIRLNFPPLAERFLAHLHQEYALLSSEYTYSIRAKRKLFR